MLERFHRIAQRCMPAKPVIVVLGVTSLVTSLVIIFSPQSDRADFFLIPSIVALMWALSAYVFLTGFADVPRRATREDKFLLRLKLRIGRVSYWGVAVVFLALSVVAVVVSFRMLSIWLADYGG